MRGQSPEHDRKKQTSPSRVPAGAMRKSRGDFAPTYDHKPSSKGERRLVPTE